ncbi:MAG: S41 family peptidase, partial [Bacteriovoracaceae bacterium]
FEVELPWITKDFYEYQREQTLAQQSLTKTPGTKKKTEFHMRCFSPSGLFDYNQCPEFKSLIRNHAGFKFGNTFRRFNPRIEWIISEVDESGDVVVNNKKEVTPFEVLKKVRFVPSNAVVIPGAKTYPAYVTSQKTAAGVMMLVGVVNINTFSPAGAEADVLKEFKATLEAFKNLGVKRVVIDTINNGGGSLSLGMNLAQSLNSRAIEFPSVEFRLSESWIDQFERGTIWGTNDTDKELKKRVYNALLADQSSGKWLSRPFNASRLFAQAFTPNEKLKDHGFKYVLLVNEMCASMCDIFAGILQDNKMAKVLGSQTLGAGGNVVMHAAAPNSGIYVSQTESLIKRTNGEYLENNGVKPDLALKVNESTSKRYDKVLKEAFIEVLKL